MTRISIFASLALSLLACRGSDNNGDDQPGVDAPPVVGGSVTIQEVQNPAMPKGTAVELSGVVVVAIDGFGGRTGDIWVQEPGGGEFSGIKVFGLPVDQVAGLVPGDLVDITNAEKDEFALTADTSGRTVTEIKGAAGGLMTIVKTGAGTVPAPSAVDALAVANLPTPAERDAEWEKWEGVLIKVSKARQIAAPRAFGETADATEFRITGVARVQSIMTELPAESVFGVCYESITGVGDYFFNYLVLPRTADDIVPGGTACAPFATSVVELQSGNNTEIVDLTNAVVTARDDIGMNKGFWVADALQAAENNGVLVFTGATAADAQIVVGARVNVQGAADEFDLDAMGDSVTEITNATVTFVSAPAGLPTPATAGVTAAVVSDITAVGEPWEGVLVQLSTMKVTNIDAGQGKVELTDRNGGTVIVDDESFAFMPQTLNTCYAKFTGLMHVQVNDNIRTINPRSAADMLVGVGCN